jgi:riboflavin biosynthesis pyrimidine reductase
LGDEGDKAMFHGLREQFDAVLAGTGTLRTERYGRILAKPERRRRRAERGLTEEPLACIFTRSGELPHDIPLFDEPEARVVIFTSRPRRGDPWKAQVEQVAIDGSSFTVADALRYLRAEHGIRSVLCEGGPALFGAMLHEQVVDEFFLTVAPWLTGGGDGPSVTTGPQLPDLAPARLLWLLERQNSLFLRYGLT